MIINRMRFLIYLIIKKNKTEILYIDIKLSLNAWANARDYYDKKKVASIKEEKTIAASSKALKNAERKIKSDLKKSVLQEKKKLVPMRNLRWFEKFLWFISSDGYLILGGRDLLQNKILVEEHFFKNDIYVHADLKDAAVVIIKNMYDSLLVPPSTLNQAGIFSITKSNAWTSKIVTSAWWVYYDQVSKVQGINENSTGVYTILGKKNFLPPSQLILGYGILWTIDEDSKLRRLKSKLSENNQNELVTDAVPDQEITLVTEKITDISLDNKEKIDMPDIEMDRECLNNPRKLETQENLFIDSEDITIKDSIQTPLNESKYNLDEYDEPSLTNNNQIISEICASHQKIQKKRISVKERRNMKNMRMKKIQQINENNEKIEDEESQLVDSNVSVEIPSPKSINMSKLKGKDTLLSTNVRGKKGKIKKIMLKYADQDEDDRILRMELLGSNKGSKKKVLKKEEKKMTVINKDVKNNVENNHYKKINFPNNLEKKQDGLLKGKNFEVHDKKKNYETDLDVFVPFPLPDDILIEAIPICAPYLSMAKYKYKIKLQPGMMKKGKVIRNIMAYWNKLPVDIKCENKEKMFPKEKELIQSLRDSELLAPVYVSNIKTILGKSIKDKY